MSALHSNNSQEKKEISGGAEQNVTHLALIIVFGICATTLAQPQALGKIPLQHLLKDGLHVSKTEMSVFFFWCGLFWYLKPIAGILTDAFPLFKTRRRSYLLLSSVLSGICWIALGIPALKMSGSADLSHQPIPYTYGTLLAGCILINLFMVMASTVVGGFLVEAGRNMNATGRLTSVRQLAFNFCNIVSGPLGGWLASGIFFRAAGINALFIISIFPIAYFFLKERPQAVMNKDAFKNAREQLITISKSRNLWFALVFVLLFYFAPGFSTPLYYRQTEELKLSQQQIGNFGVYSGIAGMLAALLYSWAVKRFNIRTLVFTGVAVAIIANLGYLFYDNSLKATLIETQNGFLFGFAEVAIIDLAARATPIGCEGVGYSLLLSARNMAGMGGDIIGSRLSDAKWPFHNLVFLNAGTTALVLILVPLLPAVLMSRKDGDAPPALDEPAGRGHLAE